MKPKSKLLELVSQITCMILTKIVQTCYLLLSEACFFMKMGLKQTKRLNSCFANRDDKNVVHW